MATSTRNHSVDPELVASRMFAEVFQAYVECSEEIQGVIRDMVELVNDPETSENDVALSLATISEALFPSRHGGHLGVDLDAAERLSARKSKDVKAIQNAMDSEEKHFSARVQAILFERGMTQGELAEACDMGQPAVSNLLARRSRPQRRTVEKFARALGVHPSELWPDFVPTA